MLVASRVVMILFDIYTFAILLQVLSSWVLAAGARLPLRLYDALHVLHRITAPVLDPIRRLVPPIAGMDLSPIIAMFLLQIIEQLILSVIL